MKNNLKDILSSNQLNYPGSLLEKYIAQLIAKKFCLCYENFTRWILGKAETVWVKLEVRFIETARCTDKQNSLGSNQTQHLEICLSLTLFIDNSFILYCRCLFWIYLLMMLSTTVGCLIIFHLTKDTVEMGDDVIPAVNDAT